MTEATVTIHHMSFFSLTEHPRGELVGYVAYLCGCGCGNFLSFILNRSTVCSISSEPQPQFSLSLPTLGKVSIFNFRVQMKLESYLAVSFVLLKNRSSTFQSGKDTFSRRIVLRERPS